ncbi:hypothetical protein OIU74_028152 [Salix koriyanagi]|uniref:Uncharacterized protein n=1 Tax=Salix koriyanagi TaxID=2511006 RepID=A0A9Q0VBR6_9ROSI|nr:hypothetical protein OIU74_028152 [Salix koriyanagi]
MGFASSTFVKEYDKSSVSAGLEVPAVPGINPADAVIESFVKGKVLPQRGNLLQAVMETGPSSSNTTSCRPTSTVEKSSSIATVQDATCFHYH